MIKREDFYIGVILIVLAIIARPLISENLDYAIIPILICISILLVLLLKLDDKK